MHLSEVVVRARRQVRAGLRYVMQVPSLRISCAILLVVGLASYNFTVVMPLFVKEGLHGTDTQYTLVYAALSVGGVIGTLLFARRPSVDLRTVVNTSLLLGSTLIVLSLMPNTGWACLIAAGVGAAAVSYFAATTSLAQLETRADMKGRVLALQTALQLGTTPIGGPLLGALADVAGGRAPVMVGGLAAAFAGLFGLGANRLLTRSSERHRRTTSKRELI